MRTLAGAIVSLAVAGNAHAQTTAGEQVFRADIKTKLPAEGSETRVAPLEFTVEAPGLLLDALTGRAEVGANGTVLTVNSLTGAVGKSRFNGQASVDFADKPAVRLNCCTRLGSFVKLEPRKVCNSSCRPT